MAAVGFVVHHDRPEAAELAREAARWLSDRDHGVRLTRADAAAAGLEQFGCEEAELVASGLDVIISIGGDGTMLRAVDLVSPAGIPVLGINVGRLGFLTEIEPAGLRMALKRFLSGSHVIEERMLLSVDVEGRGRHTALNEAVIEKTPMGHTVRLSVAVDGAHFTTYQADGLIAATPTGSTAYSMSARGPIIAPTHRALLLTPVSPHMLFDRSLVLGPSTMVRIAVEDDRDATVSVDGRNLGPLSPGQAVECTAAPHSARLVTFQPRDFLHLLRTKFGLGDR